MPIENIVGIGLCLMFIVAAVIAMITMKDK